MEHIEERFCSSCNASLGELFYLEWTQQAFMCEACKKVLYGHDSPTEDEEDWAEEWDDLEGDGDEEEGGEDDDE